VLIITFESQQAGSEYIRESGISWPIVLDNQRHLYNNYNMYRASFWDVWGLRSCWAYLKQLVKGRLPKALSSDIYQRGGDVLIDDQGVIRLHHVGTGPADRPAIDSILKIVDSALNQ